LPKDREDTVGDSEGVAGGSEGPDMSEDVTQFEPLVECSASGSGDLALLGPLGVRLSLGRVEEGLNWRSTWCVAMSKTVYIT
jgi:hypothetical protein